VLESKKDGDLYVGFTIDLKNRIKEHNSGFNFSTRRGRPWQVIHFEGYRNDHDARRRERYLKTNQGSRLLKRMLKEYFYAQRSKN
jgi:putative endonuclease